jgi:hypothetical protein
VFVRRRLAIIALLAGLAVFAAPSASASRHFLGGIMDEPSTIGNPDWAFPQYKSLGLDVLRVNLYWGGPTGVARRRRPANPINPADPAYDWSVYDAMVKRSTENQIKPVFSILWTPGWAGPRQNRAPLRMIDLRNFAFAAAKRYSGSFRPTPESTPLPAVRLWTAWNEPNNPIFLQPQFVRAGSGFIAWSPRIYAQICNAVWTGVHLTGFSGEKVACGVTAPRGNNSGRQPRASVSPIYFLRGMKKAGAHFDAYAHHPYAGPRETPRTPPPGGIRVRAVTLGNISVLINELTHLYGRKQLWITEYAYQTNPPDRLFGVSWAKQAQYLSQAFAIARANPRIDMMIWFMLKDDPRITTGWQSGLYTVSGRRKPSWSAFQRVFQ